MIPRLFPGHMNVLTDSLSRENKLVRATAESESVRIGQTLSLLGASKLDIYALIKTPDFRRSCLLFMETYSWKVDFLF